MFNPFEKSLKDVTRDDLNKLIENNFCESLFIEYKSEMPDARKIAKAIAGFANSYGGYLIIGADKNCGKEEIPDSFPGASNMSSDPKEKIRNICKTHISPMPLYQSHYITVNDAKGILIIHIPESSNCPHINKDGRVYRRQSSGTDGESIAEDSRVAIDYLYAKGMSSEAELKGYISDRQDPHNVNRLNLGNRLSIEMIVCPIPISGLIPDLFED
jgi:predicted HTH transcriptional regulator